MFIKYDKVLNRQMLIEYLKGFEGRIRIGRKVGDCVYLGKYGCTIIWDKEEK
jgi:hypothetical protein